MNELNEIVESYKEHLSTTANEIAAALLTLAEVLKNKEIEINSNTIDYLADKLRNE